MSGLRATVGAQIRRHPVLRAVAGAVVDRLVAGAHVPPPGLRAGRAADPDHAVLADRLPTALVLCLGADEPAVTRTVRDLQVAAGLAGVRPVLVLDRPHFAVARRAGVPVEHLVAREAWEQRHAPGTWAEHVRRELAAMRHAYSATATVLLPSDGTAAMDLEVLSVLLAPEPAGRVRRTWAAGVLKAARALDQPLG